MSGRETEAGALHRLREHLEVVFVFWFDFGFDFSVVVVLFYFFGSGCLFVWLKFSGH